MEPIKNNNERESFAGQAVDRVNKTQKRVVRSIFNNMAMIVGMFIIFVVIVVFTTDVKISGALHWAEIGLTFFILLFCSYSMYVNFVGSGTRAGKATKSFIDTHDKYEKLKQSIIDKKQQNRIGEFCRYYTKEELKNARNSVLSEVGIKFEDFEADYIGKSEEDLAQFKKLTKPQVDAIKKANAIKPIKLTPEMIMKRGRGNSRRAPLGMKPETRKSINYTTKFIYTAITSFLTGVIFFDVIIDPTWATFAACCLKVLLVVLNGFFGYKMGYENITIHTVEYMSDQIDLMQQLIQYIEANPEPVVEEEEEQPEEEAKIEASEPEIVKDEEIPDTPLKDAVEPAATPEETQKQEEPAQPIPLLPVPDNMNNE